MLTFTNQYSDVMRYISYTALATSVLMIPLGLLLPNVRLGDGHNVHQDVPAPETTALTTPNESVNEKPEK